MTTIDSANFERILYQTQITYVPKLRKCKKPDCDRTTEAPYDYCCEGCKRCDELKCEVHEGEGPLSHTKLCNWMHEAHKR